jgi:hypothetical protein
MLRNPPIAPIYGVVLSNFVTSLRSRLLIPRIQYLEEFIYHSTPCFDSTNQILISRLVVGHPMLCEYFSSVVCSGSTFASYSCRQLLLPVSIHGLLPKDLLGCPSFRSAASWIHFSALATNFEYTSSTSQNELFWSISPLYRYNLVHSKCLIHQ